MSRGTDTCNGDHGFDQAFGCEVMSGVEVVIPGF